MTETPAVIKSREAFRDGITDLVNAAERGDVDIAGAYGIENPQTDAYYEVEVVALDPNHG